MTYDEWIGRDMTEIGVIATDQVERLAATLDMPDPTGAAAPPLAHWLTFLPKTRQSALGVDGHAARGGFLPPIDHLPRRLWAGSRLEFHRDLPVDRSIERRSTIETVDRKVGRSGELVFVTIRHEISEIKGPVCVTDRHEIVFHGGTKHGDRQEPPLRERGIWHREIVPDPVLMFRYSALTFNGHRIHYDRTYATETESYPGLVVHGPLTATLLVDLVRRMLPDASIRALEFRAISQLFDGHPLHLNGTPPDAAGRISLWALNHEDRLAMTATAMVNP